MNLLGVAYVVALMIALHWTGMRRDRHWPDYGITDEKERG